MLEALWLIPTLPLAGAALLIVLGGWFDRRGVALVGVGSVALAALVTLLITFEFLTSPPPERVYVQTLWTWIGVADFSPAISLYLDSLSLIMTLIVTFVGSLIHVYAAEFMLEDSGYRRFFAYMNLFVAMMLTLVLADNLLLLYLGWEGVGLCSYLLIGFWYADAQNGRAARKAFIVTRIGDSAMAIGLFLIFFQLRTLDIQTMMVRAAGAWPTGSAPALAAAALLLGGAIGKSAQLPLQTWLPDAMAGPTPVSALIHAATMVTAGMYLIARTHGIFLLAPEVMHAVAAIGAATLLIAACSALAQRDIKRVLAYSTISQIGYMFLALGVGAWGAAVFHFFTHAFFKALLFLAAGVVILAQHHEHDIFRMGGLRRQLPLTFWTFLAGGAALAGFPLVTAGFYSKDSILVQAWSSPLGGGWLWLVGYAGAILTAVYTFRVIFVVFFGTQKIDIEHRPGPAMRLPLAILAALSLLAGFLELPHTLGHVELFSSFIHTAVPLPVGRPSFGTEVALQIAAAAGALGGIGIAYYLYLHSPRTAHAIAGSPFGGTLQRWWLAGWGFDWLYDRVLVGPFVWIAQANRSDFVDRIYDGVAWSGAAAHRLLSPTQSGLVRRYAFSIVAGSLALVAVMLLS